MGEDEEDGIEYEFERLASSKKSYRENVQKISHGLAEDIESNSKSLSVLIGALGLMILAFVFYGIELYDFSQSSQLSDREIEGEITNVTLTDRYAEPFRPTIAREDGIRFLNNGSRSFNLSFDRDIESFVLEPGAQKL